MENEKTLGWDLLNWYDRSKRELPWRDAGLSPYGTWVSEIMLQQTRVDTVIPYFERFMERFPTVDALGQAPLDEVLKYWAGLGYYSRARNLHRGAQMVANTGVFPGDVQQLRELPGVGPYVAGAIASIALGQDEPTVDGNIERVLSRIKELSIKRKEFFEVARGLLVPGRAGDFNQALMDLGATICTPTSPDCASCPVSSHCGARAAGTISQYPPPKVKKKPKKVQMVALVIFKDKRILMVKRPESGLFGGMYDLPGGEMAAGETVAQAAQRVATQRLGLTLNATERIGQIEHVLTHRKLTLGVVRGDWTGTIALSGFTGHRWESKRDALDLGVSTLAKKAIKLLN